MPNSVCALDGSSRWAGSLASCRWGTKSLERNIPVFLGWVLIALVFEHFQRLDQALSGFARMDDGIHEPALGSHVGIGEAVAELFHLLGPHRFPVGRVFELALVDDVYGALGSHHGDLGGRPGVVHIGAN